MLGLSSLFGGGGLFGGPSFSCELKAHPVSLAGREELEHGNRLILPPEVLQRLERLNVSSPMLFEISDLEGHRRTHGGVLEFLAPADTCYIPAWMLRQLRADDGDVIRFQLKQLPKATFLRIQPSSVALLRAFNPRALLENGLRDYVAATVGDCFDVDYGGRCYGLEILEVRPGDAACLVDADVEVEFATAKDAEAAAAASPSRSSREVPEDPSLYVGEGHRLGGGRRGTAQSAEEDEVDPMPWKQRIPRGVKWTAPPYGAEAACLAGGVATPGWSVPRGGGGSGAAPLPEPSPENRARALAAAEAREAAQAAEIAERRRREEEERERKARQARREEARRRAKEEERKAWARETLGLGPDGKPRKPPKRSRGARLLSAFCRCLRGDRAQAPQATSARPEPLRV